MGEQSQEKAELKNPQPQSEKISYDELNRMAGELYSQNQRLMEESNKLKEYVGQLQQQGPIIRLEFLFKVLENDKHFDSDFLITVSDEVKASLYPKQKDSQEETIEK